MTEDKPWPFRDAIVAVKKLAREAYVCMEGADADDFEMNETIEVLCGLFCRSLKKAAPEAWEAAKQDILKKNLL